MLYNTIQSFLLEYGSQLAGLNIAQYRYNSKHKKHILLLTLYTEINCYHSWLCDTKLCFRARLATTRSPRNR